jgi:hypothetical protein
MTTVVTHFRKCLTKLSFKICFKLYEGWNSHLEFGVCCRRLKSCNMKSYFTISAVLPNLIIFKHCIEINKDLLSSFNHAIELFSLRFWMQEGELIVPRLAPISPSNNPEIRPAPAVLSPSGTIIDPDSTG